MSTGAGRAVRWTRFTIVFFATMGGAMLSSFVAPRLALRLGLPTDTVEDGFIVIMIVVLVLTIVVVGVSAQRKQRSSGGE